MFTINLNRNNMKWWGWGNPEKRFPVNEYPDLVRHLQNKLQAGRILPAGEPDWQDVSLPDSRLSPDVLAEFENLVGKENAKADKLTRIQHACGKSYKDLLSVLSKKLNTAPDLVVFIKNPDDVKPVFALCRKHALALVPFGGGTSVVGGVSPLAGNKKAVVTLNLTNLNRVLHIDPVSQTVEVEAGIMGPDLETELSRHGLQLGHFPQSFEYSTVGGWIAARSSGQNSLAYGGIEKMVVSLKIITPQGDLKTINVPRHAEGPDLKEFLIGSEGCFGVIVSAVLRVHALPERQDYFMLAFKDFASAVSWGRGLVQSGVRPALLRLSDGVESELMLAFQPHKEGFWHRCKKDFGKWYLKRRGSLPPEGCFVLVGLEGGHKELCHLKKQIHKSLKNVSPVYLGRSPGKSWLKNRFYHPYARDEFLANGLFVDTLETAALWSNLDRLYSAVRGAIESVFEADDLPVLIATHVSHVYPDGASLYFSILGKRHESALDQWNRMKMAVAKAIRDHGGVISHHHGVGEDHRAFVSWDVLTTSSLSALKNTFDPDGILNPEKLLGQ